MTLLDKKKQVFRIAFLLFGMYALVTARLFHVQVTTGADFAHRQEVLHRRLSYKVGTSQFERAQRGSIVDQDGRVLAMGYDTYCLMIDPALGHRNDKNGEELSLLERVHLASEVLVDLRVECDRREFFERGTETTFLRTHDDGRVERVPRRSRLLLGGFHQHQRRYFEEIMRENRIRNFFFEAESQREYPEGDLVAEIVGFVGKSADEPAGESRGRAGIEFELEEVLSGRDGRYRCEKDGRGRELDVEGYWEEAPIRGGDVGLSLDVHIQGIVTEALRVIESKYDCEAVTGIVIETETGRILAMKSLPSFSIDALRAGEVKMADTRCRAVSDSYPPGSTFKPFVMARAIEEGLVTWDERFETGNGVRTFHFKNQTRVLRDSHPHVELDARQIIIESSNIGMAIIGHERMGLEKLYAAVDSFGFRDVPGILMPNQPRGWYPALSKARPLSAGVSIPFGQEIRLSPLEVCAKFSIFGTGGVYHQPRIVDWVGIAGEQTENVRKSWRMLPERVADEMKDVLVQTVVEGTAKSLANMKWTVGAKTGTAQIINQEGVTTSYNSSIVALAPATHPRITVYVGIHGLRGAEIYGGQTAGPATRRIIEGTLARLSVPADGGAKVVEEMK